VDSSVVWPHAATLQNYPHQCILIGYFNKCNFSKIE